MNKQRNPLVFQNVLNEKTFSITWAVFALGAGCLWLIVANDLPAGLVVGAIILMTIPLVVLCRRVKYLDERFRQVRFNMRQMLDATDDLIFLHDASGKIISANLSAARKLGFSRAELHNMSLWDIDEDCVLKNNPIIQNRLQEGRAVNYCSEFVCRNGHRFPVDIMTRPVDWLSEDLFVSIVKDVTRWREAEQQLERSRKELERARNRLETRVTQKSRELVAEKSAKQLVEQEIDFLRELLHTIIDAMPSALIAVNNQRKITLWNRAAEEFTGIKRDKVINHQLMSCVPYFDKQLTRYIELKSDGVSPTTHRLQLEFGDKKRLVEILIYELQTETVEGWVIRADDVTEKAAIEEMLVQSEKMLSLGGLAAGMAHEINNPLGAILQSVQTIKRRLSPDFHRFISAAEDQSLAPQAIDAWISQMGIRQSLTIIESASRRAADIVQDMLSFARPDQSGNERLVLQEIIEDSIRLAQREYNARKKFDFLKIRVLQEYQEQPVFVMGRRSRLQQVFLNLLTNAAEAMHIAGTQKPTIRICVRVEANWANILIADNGPGMPEQVRRRVFEPFYTTKNNWQGTGLGLSVSYFIVTEQMGGTMFVESAPGAGTQFTVRLPLADQSTVFDTLPEDGPTQFELPLQSLKNESSGFANGLEAARENIIQSNKK